jgi:H+/Cl- antiporter ClcA
MAKPSVIWYLLPILLGPIGGIIGYFLVKNRDRKFAERLLIVGLIMVAVYFVISLILSALAYIYLGDIAPY